MGKYTTLWRLSAIPLAAFALLLPSCGELPDPNATWLQPPPEDRSDWVRPAQADVKPRGGAHATPPTPLGETRVELPRRAAVKVALGRHAANLLGGIEVPFERTHTGLDLQAAPMSDRDAVDLLLLGRTEAAVITGYLSPREQRAGLQQVLIGHEVLALVVHPQQPLPSLTRWQVRDVLTGEVGDWQRVSGGAGPIQIVLPSDALVRERMSRQLCPGDPLAKNATLLAGDCAVLAMVARTPGSLGVVRLAALREHPPVRVLAIDHVQPGADTLVSGFYPFSTPVHVATTASPTDGAQRVVQVLHAELDRGSYAELMRQ